MHNYFPDIFSNSSRKLRVRKEKEMDYTAHKVKSANKADVKSRVTYFIRALTLVIFATIFNFLYYFYFPRLTPVVTIDDGKIQGIIANSRGGREYYQFLSIPYAEPPLGSLRFKPPIPIKPWKHVKKTQDWPPFCAQHDPLVTKYTWGQEDCLFLNVYSPPIKANATRSKFPVLVHIHGGGFFMGSSQLYRPDYFMDHKEIVIVTFSYRVGPMGFLNFQHDPKTDGVDLPRGNMGLKDQLLALKWVQRNIHNFGGDPDNVLLFGESAGGHSVHFHVLSPQSKGLFHRAMSHTGSALTGWGFNSNPKNVAQTFATRMGCPLENNSMLLDCLVNYDAKKMSNFQFCPGDPTVAKDLILPSIEIDVEGEDAFLLDHPRDILKSGLFSKVPYMLGASSGDASLRIGRIEGSPHYIDIIKANWSTILKDVVFLDKLAPFVAEMAKSFYFRNNETFHTLDNQAFLDKLSLLLTDVTAFGPVHRAAVGHAKVGAPTYLFLYNYKPNVLPGFYSLFKGASTDDDLLPFPIKLVFVIFMDYVNEWFGGKGNYRYGVPHGEDVLQLWNMGGLTKYVSWWEQEFSDSFVKTIVEFANGGDVVAFKGTAWPSIKDVNDSSISNSKKLLPFMTLDNSKEGKIVYDAFGDRFQFWDSVGIEMFN